MPAVMGIIADRWVPAQKLYGFCHFMAAVFMVTLLVGQVLAYDVGMAGQNLRLRRHVMEIEYAVYHGCVLSACCSHNKSAAYRSGEKWAEKMCIRDSLQPRHSDVRNRLRHGHRHLVPRLLAHVFRRRPFA